MTKLITSAIIILALSLAGCSTAPAAPSYDGIPPADLARWESQTSDHMLEWANDRRVAAAPEMQASVLAARTEFNSLRAFDALVGTHEAESFFQEYSQRMQRMSAASAAAEARGKGI